MTYIAARRCREISEHGSRMLQENLPRPLKEWENKAAVVLLGPPGSGKSELFEQEAKRQGGFYVTVRDSLTFDNQPERDEKTLFIDGLDETRAGKLDGRTPLDSIRAKLDRMGRHTSACPVERRIGSARTTQFMSGRSHPTEPLR